MAWSRQHLYRLLRWSEKYTKTDMVYLFRGGSWSLLATVLSGLIAFGTSLAFANLLPKETYGTYQYVLSLADLFGIFVLGGVDASYARSVARGMDGSLWNGLYAKIRWGLIGGAGSILLGCYYLLHANTILGYAFCLAGALIPFWEAPSLYVGYLQGKKRFDLGSMFDVGSQLIASLITVSAILLTKNVLVILAAYLLGWGLARFVFLWLAVRIVVPNTVHDPETVNYGKHLTVMSAVSTFASSMDDLLLWHALGPAAVASYVFASALPIRAAGVIKTVNRLAFPKLAVQEHETLRQTLPRKVLLLAIFSSLAALAYVIVAPTLFKWFFPQYSDVVPYTRALAILMALQPFNLFSTALSAQAKKRALYVYNIAVPAVRIGLLFILIPLFGIWGAVFSFIFTDLFDSAIITVLFYL